MSHEKFAGSRADITDFAHDRFRRGIELLNLGIGKEWRWGFFDKLLVAALQRAIAGAYNHGIAKGINETLGFNVARLIQITFNKTLAPAEACDRFANSRCEEFWNLFQSKCNLEATTATTMSSFNCNG